MTKRTRCYIALLVLSTLGVWASHAEEDPITNVSRALWHPSTTGVSLLGHYRSADPLAVLSFPHLHALAGEARLALGGGGVLGGDEVSGGAVALIVPGRRLVWNGALSAAGDAAGFHSRGVVAVARPISGRLLGGVGVGLTVAAHEEELELGAGVDLGFRYDLGVFRDLSRVDLHGALLNVGAPVRRGPYDPIVPVTTPVLGVRARLIDAARLSLDATLGVSSPAFSDLAMEAGGALTFRGGLSVHTGWRTTIDDLVGGGLPGISLGMRFPLGDRPREKLPEVHLATRPVSGSEYFIGMEFSTGFETADQRPPTVSARLVIPEPDEDARHGLPSSIALTPNADAAQLAVEIAASDDRAIDRVQVAIVDDAGREIRNWNLTPVGSTVPTGTLTERLVADLWTRDLVGSVYWDVYDGVPDGIYSLRITARDRAGNETSLPEMRIRVDGTPPFMEAMVVPVYADGAPAGEPVTVRTDHTTAATGEIRIAPERDLRFTLRYRGADRVSIHVIDEAGRRVVPLSAQPVMEGGDQVLSLTWPGTERDGTRIPEGVYRVRAEAWDELQNRSVITSPPILIQSVRPDFRITISDTIVAPTGDGNRDYLVVTPRLETVIGLQDWFVELINETGQVIRRWSGIDLPPREIVLGEGVFPEDGIYRVRARSRYRHGTVAEDESESFIVDTVPPRLELVLDRIRIQPDVDPELLVFIEPDPTATTTRLMVRDDQGNTRVAREWMRAPESFSWQLLFADGSFLEPGRFFLFLEAEDAAGNLGRSAVRPITLLEQLDGVRIAPEREIFGPTANGRFDTLRLSLAGSRSVEPEGEFSVVVHDVAQDDQPIRRFAGSLPLPKEVVWDGRDDRGQPVADGFYRAVLTVTVPERGSVVGESSLFEVDTRAPQVGLELGNRIVSPDGDGIQDELLLRPALSDSGIARFVLFSEDDTGRYREIDARLPDPATGETAWTPRRADGTILPDGNYSIALKQEDSAGNIGRSEPITFQVDTRPVSGFVRINRAVFSPGSQDYPAVEYTPVLPVRDGLVEWTLQIISWDETEDEDDDHRTVHAEIGGSEEHPPETLRWRGKDFETGELVPDGRYYAVLRARYRHGPTVDVNSPPVLLDTTPPEVSVEVAPQPFAPDGDGFDDTVEFSLSVEDAGDIRYWILEIFDPRGEFFYDLGGRGEPPLRIRWDGRARNDELVVSAEKYPWRLEVADEVGNTTVVSGDLEVDVLVERFGEGYRIRLPGITFSPGSAVLDLDPDTPTGRRNRELLDRLVETLRRFPDYTVLVESHEVSLLETEEEERSRLIPLTRERASAVRDALVAAGVPARLVRAEGRGGTAPVVPHADQTNRWKNRRIDFILNR